ncbi:MAG: nicotinamide-nucleotide amidase [Gammaproteobacteria bacterium]|nr:nicotinamide-nucleotide amidase [Gammaproteobacteria bacterium]
MSADPVPTDADLARLACRAGEQLLAGGLKVALAESCTGGWVAKALTDIAGSSQWFERGYVSYSNEAKRQMLGVRSATLAAHGAVSAAVVAEMAAGALAAGGVDVAVAISGVAGPDGGSVDKPVGLVWFAVARRGDALRTRTERRCFAGERESVRRAAVAHALRLIASAAGA